MDQTTPPVTNEAVSVSSVACLVVNSTCLICGAQRDGHVYNLPFRSDSTKNRNEKLEDDPEGTDSTLSCFSCISSVSGLLEQFVTNRTRVSQDNHTNFTHNDVLSHAYDFDMQIGTPVLAARDGIVVSYLDCFTKGGLYPELKKMANFVCLRHDPDQTSNTSGRGVVRYSRYFHLAPNSVIVREGEFVRCGQVIARSGNTGYTGGPHLHFDVTDCDVTEICEMKVYAPTMEKSMNIKCSLANFSPIPPLSSVDEQPWVSATLLQRADPFLLDSSVVGIESKKSPSCDASVVMGNESIQVPTTKNHDDVAVKTESVVNQGNFGLLCERGGCDFFQKAQRAQEAGAKYVVIMDNDPTMTAIVQGIGKENLTKEERELIQIPVVFVTRSDGLKISKYVDESDALLVTLSRHPCFTVAGIQKTVYQGDSMEPRIISAIQPMTIPVLFNEEIE